MLLVHPWKSRTMPSSSTILCCTSHDLPNGFCSRPHYGTGKGTVRNRRLWLWLSCHCQRQRSYLVDWRLSAFIKWGKPLSIIPSNANVCDSLISAQGYGDWITGFGEPYLILNTMRTGFLSLIESPETQCPAVTTDTLETHAKSLWSIPTTGVGLSKVLGLKP